MASSASRLICLISSWQNAVYTVDNTTAALHTAKNKGHESTPYLTYIVENYDRLPSTIAFLHSHKNGYPQAWHNDNDFYDNALNLRDLNTTHVQNQGYVNLRCNDDPGCPVELDLTDRVPNPDRTAELAMPHVWATIFDDVDMPERIGVPCCAQFAVSRDQVLTRPLSDYKKYLDFLLDTELDDETSGRVFEYLWHIIFGKSAIYCPDMLQCYCETYGRCNLAFVG